MKKYFLRHTVRIRKWIAKDILREIEHRQSNENQKLRTDHQEDIEKIESRIDKYVKQFMRVEVEGHNKPPEIARIMVEYSMNAFGFQYGNDRSNKDRDIMCKFMSREVEHELRRSVYVSYGAPVIIPKDRREDLAKSLT